MSTRAVLVVGHGSHFDINSSKPLWSHVDALRTSGRYAEVGGALWKEEPSLARGLDPFVSTDVTVVPLFMSDGYFAQEVVPREMRLTGPITCLDGRVVRYTRPVGVHPALADVVAQRAAEAGAGRDAAVAVLGHGTRRNRQSEKTIFEQGDRVRALGRFAEVVTVFIDQDPGMDKVFAMTSAARIVMVPLFVADGWHVGQTIPGDMGIESGTCERDGRELLFTPAVGSHPAMVDVIHDLVTEAACWTKGDEG